MSAAQAHRDDHAVRLTGVRKHYGAERVLEIEELAFRRGETVVATGGNGSGKSTLLRIVARASRPDQGVAWRHADLAAGRLGYVPQSGGLYGELSVEENLRLRRRIFGLRDIPLTGRWYVDGLGLDAVLGKRFAALSGGYQRLAAIAAAVHVEPTWLVLDEPFSGVDATRREVAERGLLALGRRVQLLLVAAPAREAAPAAGTVLTLAAGQIR